MYSSTGWDAKKLSAYIYSVLIYNDELRVFGERLISVVSMTTPQRIEDSVDVHSYKSFTS